MSTLAMAPTTPTTTTTPTTPTTTAMRTADCRKFSPNIFNKSKCSHCFRQREEHSAAALECNRASRKVSKCGYLFVAPDWDFSNPLYRTKRWQRRWFVLYDDGELTYSVDEHPETVPQACIDMTKVLEVTTAEDVTGHLNSIAITAPDRITFVKGTCPEESKWWLNILAAFPKSKGRHKRNATFPGGQATTILQGSTEAPATIDGIVVQTRNRHNSYHKDALTSAQSTGVLIGSNHSSGNSSSSNDKTPATWKHGDLVTTGSIAVASSTQTPSTKTSNGSDVIGNQVVVVDDDEEDDGVETGEDEDDDVDNDENIESDNEVVNTPAAETNVVVLRKPKIGATTTTNNKSVSGTIGQDENNRNAGNEITNRVSQSCLLIEDIRRDEKTIKDIANTITNLSQHQKHRWSTTAAVNNVLNSHLHHSVASASTSGTPTTQSTTNQQHKNNNINNNNNICKDEKCISRDEIDFQRRPTSSNVINLRPKSLPLAANSTPAIVSAIVKKIPPVLVSSSSSASVSSSTTTTTTLSSTSSASCDNTAGDSNNNTNNNNNNKSNNNGNFKSKSSPRLQLQLKHLQQKHQSNQQRQQKHFQQQQQHQQLQQHAHERGDPDGGCNLDDLSSNYLAKTAELRVNVPTATPTSPPTTTATSTTPKVPKMTATPTTTPLSTIPIEESLDAKKGWLMKQDNRTSDWTKHWFTLSGAALFYYRDPVSEERGVLDGVLDVNSLTNIAEVNANRNYAFQLTTWDKRRLTLASLSPNSRNSWIAVLRNAAGLKNCNSNASKESTSDNNSGDIKTEIERDFIKAQKNHEIIIQSYPESNNNNISPDVRKSLSTDASPSVMITSPSKPKTNVISPITPSTPKSAMHFSSDEEYRTASEGGRRDSIDWGSPQSPSPPIPPLSLLRAKERMRTRTSNCPRLHKRSRSSPPSSRRSTVDSVGSDELPPIIHTVQEELNIDKELQFRLSLAEKERETLRAEAKERDTRLGELLTTLERTEQELSSRIQEMENVRGQLTKQLEDAKQNAAEIVDRLSEELEESHKKIKDLEDRLARGIDENEALYKRLRELESCSPSSFSNLNRSKIKRMDSLSDLTQINAIDPYCIDRDALAEEYNELRTRFEKAVNEIKAMKRELKESQNQFDSLEISYAALKQDMERKEVEDRSQMQMMAERIQDLTLKYSSSERQVRTLKQKLAKSERRRSLSLKGKEQLTVSKELEVKVSELESKIDEMEKSTQELKSPTTTYTESSMSSKHSGKKSARRRSLETTASADSLQFMVRVSDLERRFDGVSGSPSSSSTPTPSIGTPTQDSGGLRVSSMKMSDHLIDRLRCLEGVLVASKDRLEQGLQQLQNLRSTRTRRSVSPITDRKDSYRFVERCLAEVVKLMRESCETCVVSGTCSTPGKLMLLPESSPVKLALTQLEVQLRNKLADLLKQRRMLRERNELTRRKDLELLAERIAFESVCFGRLRDSVARAENPERFGEQQTRAEVAETSHLMSMLKAKLSGKCALKPSGSVDILAGVLARRLMLSTYRREMQNTSTALEPVDQNILDELLRQQQELNVIAKRYKNNTMEVLATGLAAETLSYISGNDLVQGAVQEAWRQAQETVNAELVQSEIAHIMMRNAERFEQSIAPAYGYTLTAEERLSFEKFADAVHDALRKEMELAVAQLTHSYEESMQQMKRGQWRLHLEQERKASESRQLLAEFADIVAHKALVDARIAVLRGDYARPSQVQSKQDAFSEKIGITALQKYEELFEELSGDLQIHNPDDILSEADFEFMYKQRTVEFLNDRQTLSDISTFLSQLEDSLIALQCETSTASSISRTSISIESLQDVCHKCCELRQRADQLLQNVHRKLSTPCPHCLQAREKLCELQQQHENDLLQLKKTHAKDINAALQELEHQRASLQCVEKEKHAINSDLHRSEELIEERERDLDVVNAKLKAKEEELRRKQTEQLELLRRLELQDEETRASREESEALAMKCARQDEEYAVLLQERDQLQSELMCEKERSRRFEKRLEMLELEHTKQLECLQEAYRDQILSHCTDFTNVTDEESFRQRYQTEIEQLRTLCEKGLSAMESSHRRIISDLEEKHKQEIERLLIEKETALAEETQATLAALDAMRKAHQSEVQREVARFKQEFLRQFQQGEHTNYDASRLKEEELEELRQEILSFSEKYSIKCVENAALEEKLRSANQKLRQLQQMQQFELRNKQFRAHLASEDPTTDVTFVQGLTTTKDANGDDITCGQDSESNTHVACADACSTTSTIKVNRLMISNNNIAVANINTTNANANANTNAKIATTTTLTKNNINDNNKNNNIKKSIQPFGVTTDVDHNKQEQSKQQSFFVIPSTNLLRHATATTRTVTTATASCEKKMKSRDAPLPNSNNIDADLDDTHDNDLKKVVAAIPDHGHIESTKNTIKTRITNKGKDGNDDGDANDYEDDYMNNRRYSYEPCYKQNNLYSIQNRLSFEGLKSTTSSTFGKNLRTTTTTRKSTIGTCLRPRSITATVSTTSSNASSPATSPLLSSMKKQKLHNDTENHAYKPKLKQKTFTNIKTINLNEKIDENNINSNQNQQQHQLITNNKSSAITPSRNIIIKPVDEPKNFSANIYNNTLINNIKLDNMDDGNIDKNIPNNKLATITMKLTVPTIMNSNVAERAAAINLDSFTDFVKKSTAITPLMAGDDNDDVVDSNEQRNFKCLLSNDDNSFCSPPPLIGRDIEQLDTQTAIKTSQVLTTELSNNQQQSTSTTATKTNCDDVNLKSRYAKQHMRRFELEI